MKLYVKSLFWSVNRWGCPNISAYPTCLLNHIKAVKIIRKLWRLFDSGRWSHYFNHEKSNKESIACLNITIPFLLLFISIWVSLYNLWTIWNKLVLSRSLSNKCYPTSCDEYNCTLSLIISLPCNSPKDFECFLYYINLNKFKC